MTGERRRCFLPEPYWGSGPPIPFLQFEEQENAFAEYCCVADRVAIEGFRTVEWLELYRAQ
jgi:hypothetical protein